jgi:hypothetical protein
METPGSSICARSSAEIDRDDALRPAWSEAAEGEAAWHAENPPAMQFHHPGPCGAAKAAAQRSDVPPLRGDHCPTIQTLVRDQIHQQILGLVARCLSWWRSRGRNQRASVIGPRRRPSTAPKRTKPPWLTVATVPGWCRGRSTLEPPARSGRRGRPGPRRYRGGGGCVGGPVGPTSWRVRPRA